jgi:hypothetical protein
MGGLSQLDSAELDYGRFIGLHVCWLLSLRYYCRAGLLTT